MKGLLIYILGIDGSGKTTLLKALDNHTLNNTLCIQPFICSHFTSELEKVAGKLNDSKRNVFSQQMRSTVWMLDLIHTTNQDILPNILNGKNVIVDRYSLCSRIYLEILNKDALNHMGQVLDCLPQPDLGLYLKISVEEAIKRIQFRNKNIAPYEHTETLAKLKNRYEEYITKQSYPIYQIDANQSENDILIKALDIIKNFGGYEICKS